MLAEREPLALGVNLTVMVQLAPAASELEQLLVWLKSAVFDPVKLKGEAPRVRVVVPLLVNFTVLVVFEFTVCDPKLKLLGLGLALGSIAFPLIETCCGLPGALSWMFKVALAAPTWLTSKIILMVQLCPGVSVPQEPLCSKSCAPGPEPGVKETPVIFSVVVPVFFIVTFRTTLWSR